MLGHFNRSQMLRTLCICATAMAGLVVGVVAGLAVARTFTLVARSGTVRSAQGTRTMSIVVNGRGRAVYELTGDSRRHPMCSRANGCFGFWPPVTVRSPRKLSKGPGVKGRLGVWRRGRLLQVTLSGHPLYTYSADDSRYTATGQGLQSFGGTWHVVRGAGGDATSTSPTTGGSTYPQGSTTTTTTTTSTTTTTPSPPCLGAPCY
jgi:predicted lipoprotein with Yx(FWY)xxD motif